MPMKLKLHWIGLMLIAMMALAGCSTQQTSPEKQQITPIVTCEKINPAPYPKLAGLDTTKLAALRAANDEKGLIKFLQDAYFNAVASYTQGAYTYNSLIIKSNGLQDCLTALDKKGLIIYQGK
jgi:hypothetical protein